jgi:S-adenosylmethionine:tRNA ribosyltransferase-isomerase
MRVDLFDFDLPDERIALRPAEPRDSARLLVVRPGEALQDRIVNELPSLLSEGDVLVFNDTKVIPAQLKGIRRRGEAAAQVEATLHMRVAPDRWQAFMRPGKRVRPARCHRYRERRGWRSAARLRSFRAVPRRGAARRRPHSAAALHRLQA